jgi:hypothetical protein
MLLPPLGIKNSIGLLLVGESDWEVGEMGGGTGDEERGGGRVEGDVRRWIN